MRFGKELFVYIYIYIQRALFLIYIHIYIQNAIVLGDQEFELRGSSPDLTYSNPDRVKPMTLKFILLNIIRISQELVGSVSG